jgi:hypothetical protein
LNQNKELDWRVLESQILDMKLEATRCLKKHGPFHSEHEFYAILMEEVEELWEVIKKAPLEHRWHKRQEAIQIGALILAFLDQYAPILGPEPLSFVPKESVSGSQSK